jgi:peptide/nickel transport system permease protein
VKQGSLARYFVVRILLAIPMLFILLTGIFLILRVAPGNPVKAALGSRLPPKEIAARIHALGYDQSIWEQYWHYLSGAVTGHYAHPLTDTRSVGEIIGDTAPATIELAICGMIVAVVVGITVGALAGRFRDTPFDLGGRLFGIVIYATPVFWTAILAQLFFAVKLGWLPSSGRLGNFQNLHAITHFDTIDSVITGNWSALGSTLQHLILPAITLGLLIGGTFIRMVRVNMLQTMRSDYVEAARARVVRERSVIYKHAFRNAMIPVFTIMGLQFALMIGNATLTETVFTWPGIARALVQFIGARDYAAVQGIVTFIALVIVGISLLIDFVNALVDPRVRY